MGDNGTPINLCEVGFKHGGRMDERKSLIFFSNDRSRKQISCTTRLWESSGIERSKTYATKTQDKKSILLQLKRSGWKFTCNRINFGIETGLYFGKKNVYTENKNIYVNGEITKEEELIKWEIKKIWTEKLKEL